MYSVVREEIGKRDRLGLGLSLRLYFDFLVGNRAWSSHSSPTFSYTMCPLVQDANSLFEQGGLVSE